MTTTVQNLNVGLPQVGRSSRLLNRSLVAGAVVALVVLVGGGRYVLDRPVTWEATSSFVVFPATGTPENEAGYYETLARGQIVSTMAQIVSAQQSREDGDVVVQVVPETSLITLTATASNESAAEDIAERQLSQALAAVSDLDLPFAARTVNTGAGTANTADASTTTLVGVVVFVALVLGLLVQEGLAALGRRQRRAAGFG